MSNEASNPAADFDDALARAFAKVERARPDGVDRNIKKDGKDRRYVTLASVDAACREALTSEDFSFPQLVTTEARTDGSLWLSVTTQIRRKGYKIESTLGLPVLGQMISAKDGGGFRPPTAQSVGSAMTYGRRYALSALMGVCPDEDDDGHQASRRDEPDHDPAWERLQGLTADLARALRCSTEDAAARVKRQASDTLGTIGANGPTDAQVATLTTAAQELLEFVRNPPREPVPAPQEPEPEPAKAKPRSKAAPKPTEEEAHRRFLSSYKAYKEECTEQGLTPAQWLEIASEAIGKPWSVEKGAHTAEEWMKAAASCEQAIEKMRGAA